jgi:hypothetical protein
MLNVVVDNFFYNLSSIIFYYKYFVYVKIIYITILIWMSMQNGFQYKKFLKSRSFLV